MKPGNQPDDAASDALALLTADHAKLTTLFRQFASLRGQDDADRPRAELVEQMCTTLTLHGMLEEEIFYPALRQAMDDEDLVDEADVEHANVLELIGQLEIMAPGDDLYEAAVTALGEEVEHHIAHEEGPMFDAARRAGIDLAALGAQLAARQAELAAALSAPPARIDALAPHAGARRQPQAPD